MYIKLKNQHAGYTKKTQYNGYVLLTLSNKHWVAWWADRKIQLKAVSCSASAKAPWEIAKASVKGRSERWTVLWEEPTELETAALKAS
jgi:hypothetical protein